MAKKAVRRKPVAVVSEAEAEAVLDAELGPPVSVEVPESEPEQPKPWSMPVPRRGQAVLFYYRTVHAIEKLADVGFVTSVGQHSINIAYRNQGVDDVWHKDDPRLVDNQDIRSEIGGVWEFTKEAVDVESRLSDIEKRLEMLEG